MNSIIDNVQRENRQIFKKRIRDRERERLVDLIDEYLPHVSFVFIVVIMRIIIAS